ncbi:MAG TPA: DUF3742 family protein [Steroidobacteraceae bacterium]|nr:DUF3742 family protein [Steroidobacteraceae bacterium]
MRGYSHHRRTEEMGRRLGAAVRRLAFRNGRVTRLGNRPFGVRVLLWAAGMAIAALLLFFAFWVAVIVALAWGALKVIQLGGHPGRFKWEPTDPNNHRQSLFYHPLFYNDERDPRFSDPRFPDR